VTFVIIYSKQYVTDRMVYSVLDIFFLVSGQDLMSSLICTLNLKKPLKNLLKHLKT